MYDPLEFLANVTQHIPNKREHQVRYYGWYFNKRRGMRKAQSAKDSEHVSAETVDEYWTRLAEFRSPFQRKCRITRTALSNKFIPVHFSNISWLYALCLCFPLFSCISWSVSLLSPPPSSSLFSFSPNVLLIKNYPHLHHIFNKRQVSFGSAF